MAPQWHDRYLGPFWTESHAYDVYVYQDNELSAKVPDMHVCIRYGNDGSEYISPGSIALLAEEYQRGLDK